MVCRGVGAPDYESWSLPNSTVVSLSKFSTHKSPEESSTRGVGAVQRPGGAGEVRARSLPQAWGARCGELGPW